MRRASRPGGLSGVKARSGQATNLSNYRFDVNELVVLAVAHHKRRPGYWSRRR